MARTQQQRPEEEDAEVAATTTTTNCANVCDNNSNEGDEAAAVTASDAQKKQQQLIDQEEEEKDQQDDDDQRVNATEVRMALDRLLLADGTMSSTDDDATGIEVDANTMTATNKQQQQFGGATTRTTMGSAAAVAIIDDETDSSSSMSSHSSTLKGIIGSNGMVAAPAPVQQLVERLNTANTLLGGMGPAPPSPRSTKEQIDGVSTEETLRKMSVSKVISAEASCNAANAASRTITSRTPKDFFFIKLLGEGSFSTVYYAKEVDTGDEYAIKVLLKSEIRREGRVRYVLREKDIMAALTYAYGGHPFVIRLYCTFQDNERLYFALAYAKHGELLDWLRRLGSFDEEATLFYSSEILCALEFLHRCKVIHRDLKPENILVGADWHIILSDFGTAKILEDQPNGCEPPPIELLPPGEVPGHVSAVVLKPKSTVRSSFVGTAHYISPEVLKSEDVGPECDYWALGAIIFQMVSGQPPFRAFNEYKILKKILNLEFHFPEGFPTVAKDIVSRLLVYKPAERLGSAQTGGIDALKAHPFFKSVDWPNILTRKPPELKPYLPASCGEPAFYGDYKPQGNIQPGFNEAALSRLMGLDGYSMGGGAAGFAEFDFDAEESLPSTASSSVSSSSFGSTPTSANNAFRPTAAATTILSPEELEKRCRLVRLEQQRREHKFHRFVQENLILKSGLIDKKKGLFARRRMFLLTEGPHLFYVDPVSMHMKGEVPFSAQMRTEAKNFRTFFVHTPKRTYYLFDPERHAKDWCDAIDWARDRYFGKQQVPSDSATSGSPTGGSVANRPEKGGDTTTGSQQRQRTKFPSTSEFAQHRTVASPTAYMTEQQPRRGSNGTEKAITRPSATGTKTPPETITIKTKTARPEDGGGKKSSSSSNNASSGGGGGLGFIARGKVSKTIVRG